MTLDHENLMQTLLAAQLAVMEHARATDQNARHAAVRNLSTIMDRAKDELTRLRRLRIAA